MQRARSAPKKAHEASPSPSSTQHTAHKHKSTCTLPLCILTPPNKHVLTPHAPYRREQCGLYSKLYSFLCVCHPPCQLTLALLA